MYERETTSTKESTMKYGVYSILSTGSNLFSTHRSEKAAQKVAEKRSAQGFPCKVYALK
jgi:hypothetical protein